MSGPFKAALAACQCLKAAGKRNPPPQGPGGGSSAPHYGSALLSPLRRGCRVWPLCNARHLGGKSGFKLLLGNGPQPRKMRPSLARSPGQPQQASTVLLLLTPSTQRLVQERQDAPAAAVPPAPDPAISSSPVGARLSPSPAVKPLPVFNLNPLLLCGSPPVG